MVTTQLLCLEDGARVRELGANLGMGYHRSLLLRYLDTFPRPAGVPEWPALLPDPTAADIDAAIAEESNARDAAAKPVGDALLRDYERRRTQNKGAGAARLVGTTCQACHLTIPSTEAERIRRAAGNEVAYCDNCSAILVP